MLGLLLSLRSTRIQYLRQFTTGEWSNTSPPQEKLALETSLSQTLRASDPGSSSCHSTSASTSQQDTASKTKAWAAPANACDWDDEQIAYSMHWSSIAGLCYNINEAREHRAVHSNNSSSQTVAASRRERRQLLRNASRTASFILDEAGSEKGLNVTYLRPDTAKVGFRAPATILCHRASLPQAPVLAGIFKYRGVIQWAQLSLKELYFRHIASFESVPRMGLSLSRGSEGL